MGGWIGNVTVLEADSLACSGRVVSSGLAMSWLVILHRNQKEIYKLSMKRLAEVKKARHTESDRHGRSSGSTV